MRRNSLALVLALLAGACTSAAIPLGDVPELAPTDPAAISALLTASEQPVVLNVWASWCIPCRSEAPLLRAADSAAGADVRFIGIAVDDDPDAARRFIAEFGLTGLEHYFDANGAVPASLGGRGVPLTYFFAPGGRLVHLHSGVIDEGTLALQVDELRRTVGG